MRLQGGPHYGNWTWSIAGLVGGTGRSGVEATKNDAMRALATAWRARLAQARLLEVEREPPLAERLAGGCERHPSPPSHPIGGPDWRNMPHLHQHPGRSGNTDSSGQNSPCKEHAFSSKAPRK